MAKLAWFGFVILVANTAIACWMAWGRYSASTALDSTTTGKVVSLTKGSGRTPNDYFSATYTLNAVSYNVRGNSSEDSSLDAQKYAVGSPITVYFSSKDPSKSSLSPGGGFALWIGIAGLLLAVTGYLTYVMFLKR
jgi:Protein of unknown function (DUF3592)